MRVIQHVRNRRQSSVPCVRVLHGGRSPVHLSLVSSLVGSAVAGDHAVMVWETEWAHELLEWAGSKPHDLCLVIMNNLRFPRNNLTVEHRMQCALGVLRRLRVVSDAPIIAVSGWEPQQMCSHAKDAGADFFFPLPFCPDAFRAVVRECLAGTNQNEEQG